MSSTRQKLDKIQEWINQGSYDYIDLAVYELRDLPEVRELGLSDLLWAMWRDKNVTKQEIQEVFDKIKEAAERRKER